MQEKTRRGFIQRIVNFTRLETSSITYTAASTIHRRNRRLHSLTLRFMLPVIHRCREYSHCMIMRQLLLIVMGTSCTNPNLLNYKWISAVGIQGYNIHLTYNSAINWTLRNCISDQQPLLLFIVISKEDCAR